MKNKNKSRTEYSAVNSSVAIIARIIAILLGYAARVVFTHTLNEDYVGINGLFSNILNILSISELGMGTAITFALYKPIAEKDKEKQKSLMQLYKRFYYFVALIVSVLGLSLIPFMDILIKNKPQVEHLIIIYILFLANTVLSYIGIYKRTLIDAHQLNYISVSIQTGTWALSALLQILFLSLTRNFMAYLVIMIACTLLNNILISVKANKMYPYLRSKHKEPLPKEEKRDIVKNIKAMLLHKIGEVVVNNTDNLLISSLVSTVSVGIYSNYFLVIGSVSQVLTQMFQGIAASVGNLGVLESRDRIKRIYEAAFFLAQWIFGLCLICMFQILDSFVGFSFGPKYVFTKDITLVLCINFYLLGMRQPTLIFRDSMGLFWYDRYKSIAEAVINLVISIILGRIYGVLGIFLGTLISCVLTSLWIEPFVFYKYRLNAKSTVFFLKFALYMFITALMFAGENYLCSFIKIEGIPGALLKCIACFAATNILYLIIYCRTREFKYLFEKGITILKNKKNKKNDGKSEDLTDTAKVLIEAVSVFCKSNSPDFSDETEINLSISDLCEKNDVLQDDFVDLARKHSVLPFLHDMIVSDEYFDGKLKKNISKETRGIVTNNYRYLFTAKDIVNVLGENGISSCVLKGAATASYYKIPELRKSSDIDILIPDTKDINIAEETLVKYGFKTQEKQIALHHLVMSKNGILVELHTMLAEPFDENKMNDYINSCLPECAKAMIIKDCMGTDIAMLNEAYHAYELLLHMLQHFLREGFGLKLLCDWVVFFSHDLDDNLKKEYLRLVKESGIKGFSDAVTKVCVDYLSLDIKKVEWMGIDYSEDSKLFLKDIMNAGDFGKMENNRMVALRGSKLTDYIREFHHQMHLNFPKAGKVFVFWPVLWIATYVKFMINNRKVRGGVSSRELYKKAAERSSLVQGMNLFK